MELLGTPEGESVFRESATDMEVMKANPQGTRYFHINEWLNNHQWKARLAEPRAQLLQQYQRLVEEERNAAANAADPFRAKVFALPAKAALKRKYLQLCKNHQQVGYPRAGSTLTVVEIQNLHLAFEENGYEKSCKQLRQLLYDLVQGYGRRDADIALF